MLQTFLIKAVTRSYPVTSSNGHKTEVAATYAIIRSRDQMLAGQDLVRL